MGLGPARYLVELIQEHDAVLLHILDRFQLQLFLIDHLRRFFIDQDAVGILDLKFSRARLAAAEILKKPLKLAGHLFHAGWGHDLNADGHCPGLDLDLAAIELPLAKHLAELLPGVGRLSFG